MYSIHEEDKIKEFIKEIKEQPFRYTQIENAIYKNNVTNFDEITTISKWIREMLKEKFFYSSLEIDHIVTWENWQTTKILFKTHDWYFVESVIMRHLTGRNTLCVSCQVGCPMACSFCATWKLGLKRNLEYYEILDQIMEAVNILQKEWKILRNVVYMGMGEPMLNYENVKKSIDIATNQKKLNLANRRVTISTCWIVPGIKKFMHDFPQTSLAISLHAPDDEVRKQIMPVDHTYNLEALMKVLDEYSAVTNKRVFYEYIMIQWVNDDLQLAYKLADLLKGKLAHVNFIPYNPWEWTSSDWYKPTSRLIIEKNQKILENQWVVSTIRATMWDDMDGACGKLANKKE